MLLRMKSAAAAAMLASAFIAAIAFSSDGGRSFIAGASFSECAMVQNGAAAAVANTRAMTAACPVCGADAERFLVRESVPANQNLLLSSRAEARGVTRGTLDLHACARCGFVFNAAFAQERLDYGASYENTQTASQAFAEYLDARVARVVESCGADMRTMV